MTPEQLFEQNQDLALWMANKFHNDYEFDDIKQHAAIGLFRAAKRFDPSMGCSLSNLAIPYMKHEIIRNHFEKKQLIKVPRQILENSVKVKRFIKETDDIKALSELTGLSVKAVNEVMEYLSRKTYSLDNTVGEDEETSFAELVPDEIEDWDELIIIKDFISTLDDREKTILNMRIKGCSQTEIGQALNIS